MTKTHLRSTQNLFNTNALSPARQPMGSASRLSAAGWHPTITACIHRSATLPYGHAHTLHTFNQKKSTFQPQNI